MLERTAVLSCATIGSDGSPQVRCVSAIHFEADRFFFFTVRGNAFCKQLLADPRCQFLALTGDSEMVRLHARAVPASDEEQMRWKMRIFDEYPHLGELFFPNKLDAGIVFEVSSGFFECMDLGKTPARRSYASFGGASAPVLIYSIDESSCAGCGACAAVCPIGCIRTGHPFRILETVCMRCGSCLEACPRGAVRVSLSKELVKP